MIQADEPRAPGKLERALRAAAKRYIKGLREAERDGQRFGELRAHLLRLGYGGDIPASAAELAALQNAARRSMRELLEQDAARLARMARAGRATYDINRHIAVKRALATLLRPQSEPDPCGSGRDLNRRFARRRGETRRETGSPPARAAFAFALG